MAIPSRFEAIWPTLRGLWRGHPGGRSASFPEPLRIAVVTCRPWAYWDDSGVPAGEEVDAVREFCTGVGRRAVWVASGSHEAQARLRRGSVHLAIGAQVDDGRTRSVADVIAFSPRSFSLGPSAHGPRLRHVWAVSHQSDRLWWRMFIFLRLVRPLRLLFRQRRIRAVTKAGAARVLPF